MTRHQFDPTLTDGRRHPEAGRVATATAATTLAIATSIGLAATPAHAAPYQSISSHFTIEPAPLEPGSYHTAVIGVVTLSQAAAQDCINRRYSVQLRYWGDDPSSDDLLHGPIIAPNMYAAADGLHYQYNVILPSSILDEDNGVQEELSGNYGRDELYVGARFVDPSGKTVSQVESNRIESGF